MHKSVRIVAAIVAPVAIVATFAVIRQSANADTIAYQPRTALSGHMVPNLRQSSRTGEVAGSQRMSVSLSLTPRNAADLDKFIAQVSNPKSASYGHYLTPTQFTARYGASSGQVDKVSGYLRAQGLSVDSVSPNNLLINASGPASVLERTFGTHLSTRWDAKAQREFYANDTPPTLPSDLANAVSDVAGLENLHRLSHPPVRKPVAPTGFGPAQLTGAYDVKPLAVTGSGQKVALFELDAFQQSNITAYDKQFALTPPTPTVQKVDGGVALGEGQSEVELDIEAVQAIAPKAAITVFEGPNTSKGVIDTYAAIVASGIPVVSISWGAAETATPQADITAQDTLYKQAAAQGQSLFAASGDNGSDDAGNGSLAVDFPASDPFVTGTGGTHLTVKADDSNGGETGWVGSGGGDSTLFAAPDYQSGLGVKKRQVPDIAADADPTSGLAVFTKGAFHVIGGTSAAAPEWAAFATLYNQIAATKGKPPLGFANPALYQLPAAAGALHDIVGGSNGAFQAIKGYDRVTGLGTFDAAKFVAARLG